MSDDLRQAWRGLRAMPLVAAVVVLSLGLGIGANTTVFSWLQMARWKPQPQSDWTSAPKSTEQSETRTWVSRANCRPMASAASSPVLA